MQGSSAETGEVAASGVQDDGQPYRRVVLKLSGEVFGGGKLGVDPDVVATIARQIADVVRTGVQVAIVVGGGNFFRGAELSQRGMDRARAAAMQVAAMRPQYVSRDEIPADVVENERRIAEATAREEGKPEQALPKIVEGRVNGFFKDVALLEQPSVLDSKKNVKAVLDAAGVTVKSFSRFEVGGA